MKTIWASPLFSIITVAYNSAATITQTIESVLNQSCGDLEYWIIDGASTDDTVKIAKSYTDCFRGRNICYTIVSEADRGIYDAMNKGIAYARGEIVGLINSDDWYEPDALEKVEEAYQETDFDVLYANIRLHMPHGSHVKKAKKGRYLTSRHWNHPTTFVRREIYRTGFYYDTSSLYGDWELMLRLHRARYRFAIIDSVIANFRFGGVSNSIHLRNLPSRISQRYLAYRKNRYSRLYWLECMVTETVKYFLSK